MAISTRLIAFILSIFLIDGILPAILHAQGVGIGTTPPESTAILDITAIGKGVLVPRMTSQDRIAIELPAIGLLVYDTTTGSFWYYRNTGWTNISTAIPKLIADADGDTRIQTEESPDEDIIRFDLAGQERWKMQGTRIEPSGTGGSIYLGRVAGINDNHTDNQNVGIGDSTLFASTTAYDNIAIGQQALRSTVSGFKNIAIGKQSLWSNTGGNNNTSIGVEALAANGSGYQNTALGNSALTANTSGHGNVALGVGSLQSSVTGSQNVGIGWYALQSNTGSIGNTAVGRSALRLGQSGGYNTAIGGDALMNNQASYNTAVGFSSLTSNTTGTGLVAVGHSALYNNTTGSNNTAIGKSSLNTNTTGTNNTGLGATSLFSNTTGYSNTGAGAFSLGVNAAGYENTAIGESSLAANTTGYQNTATGTDALLSNTDGYGNVAVGYSTMSLNTFGDYNTCVGFNADFNTGSKNNATAIGSNMVVDASNKTRIGNSSVTSIGGQVGWSTYSDARIKQDIREDIPGLDFIGNLRPVSYRYDIRKEAELLGMPDTLSWEGKYDIETLRFSGFLAQEVQASAQSLGYDFSGVDDTGLLMSLRYAEFVVPLVKAVQEQQAQIEELRKQVDQARSAQAEVADLRAQVEALARAMASQTRD